jgi:hypothetical protein
MAKWQLSGDYFENCNCDVVCPCLASSAAPLTASPSRGACDVVLAFHIDKGSYDGLALDGLNVAIAAHAPGPMGAGNWSVAAYLDERASDQQTAALGAIFTGAEGGPMAAFAPLISQHLGVKKAPIHYAVQGKNRLVEIPGVMQMAVEPIPTLHPAGEVWTTLGHPVAPDHIALAMGCRGSTFADYGMRWDNSGRNGHYAPITWSN